LKCLLSCVRVKREIPGYLGWWIEGCLILSKSWVWNVGGQVKDKGQIVLVV
jgi:hypothetical protein